MAQIKTTFVEVKRTLSRESEYGMRGVMPAEIGVFFSAKQAPPERPGLHSSGGMSKKWLAALHILRYTCTR